MKFPNKIYAYKESIIYHMMILQKRIAQDGQIKLVDLYRELKISMSGSDIIDALLCLYAIGKIEFNEDTKTIKLC